MVFHSCKTYPKLTKLPIVIWIDAIGTVYFLNDKMVNLPANPLEINPCQAKYLHPIQHLLAPDGSGWLSLVKHQISFAVPVVQQGTAVMPPWHRKIVPMTRRPC